MVDIVASDLELLVIGWLNRKGIDYDFQTSLMGGHYSLGGSVVDFTIGDLALQVANLLCRYLYYAFPATLIFPPFS